MTSWSGWAPLRWFGDAAVSWPSLRRAMGVRAQAIQIDSLAKQALAMAAAAGIDPAALADRIKALAKQKE